MGRYVKFSLLYSLIILYAFPAQSRDLEAVFIDNTHQITGIALSKDNRLFITYPRWLPEHGYSVVEITQDKKVLPYPDEKWNSWKPGDDGQEAFVCAQAAFIDDRDRLWIVDPASPALAGVVHRANKLVEIDLKENKVTRIFRFEKSVAGKRSYLNDVRIDTKNETAYLTDSAEGAIIVIDLKSGNAKRRLENDPSTKSDPGYTFRINKAELRNDKGPVKINSDGIALTPDGKYLYYKPLTDTKLYRIATRHLRDDLMTNAGLREAVEFVGDVSTTDGMIFDHKGNLYLGDIEKKIIYSLNPEGDKTTLSRDKRLGWPDSYALSDNWLYITDSQIQTMPWFNGGKSTRTLPYAVYRLKLSKNRQ